MKTDFSTIFEGDRSQLRPKMIIDLNGVILGPGVTIGHGVSFAGVDVFKLYGKKLEIQESTNGVKKIVGFYG